MGGVELDGGAVVFEGGEGGGGAGVVVADAGGDFDGVGQILEGDPVAAFDFELVALEIFDRANDDAVFFWV